MNLFRFLGMLFCFSLCLSPASGAANDADSEILVGFHSNVPSEHKEKVFKSVNAKEKLKIEKINTHVLAVAPEARAQTIEKLKKHPHVRFAEPNERVAPDLIPSDTYYPNSWHHPKVEAPAAWDQTLGDSSVIVAVTDSGVDLDHPDLVSALAPDGYNFFDHNSDPSDVYGHGTKVAGTIGAAMNNAQGVVGLAAGVRILPVRVAGTDGWASWSALASGTIYSADHGARVINASFAGTSSSSTLQSAIDYAFSKNVAFFASAGNYGTSTITYPAGSNHVFGIAATDSADNRSSFSSYGPWITMSAPGSGIWTTTNGGGYGSVSGTSFASPLAAAGAALALSANPGLDIYSLREVMLLGADDLGASGFDQYFGHGRLNVRKAVEAAKAYAPVLDTTPPTVAITSPTNDATISSATYITVTAADNRDISKIEVFDNEQLLGTVSGAQGSVYWPALQGGSHVLKATAWDAAGNSASASISVSVPVDTQAPVVTISQPVSGSSITKLRKVSIQASATDNRGVANMALLIDGKSISSVAASSLSYTWNVSKVASGSHVIRVKACDAALNCAAVEVSVVK